MESTLGLDKMIAVHGELHVGLSGCLGHGQNIDACVGQCPGGFGENPWLGDIGADGTDNGDIIGGNTFKTLTHVL